MKNRDLSKGELFSGKGVIARRVVRKVLTGLILAFILAAGSLDGLVPGDAGFGVQAVEPVRVYPGGESIGVFWKTGHPVVSGYAPLVDEAGRYHCPAARAGLAPGDLLLAVNDDPVADLSAAAALIDRSGQKGRMVRLTVQRGRRELTVSVVPVRCRVTARYRVGLLLRDSAAGIGTLTFFDRATGRYGAVGHAVTADGEQWPGGGYLLEAPIGGIVPGVRGRPGEKVGLFGPRQEKLGSIDESNRYGIFGRLTRLPRDVGTPLAVAPASQVHSGPCEILTVVRGQKVERFSAEILWVHPGAVASGRGLGLKITDPRLLSLAGGIVQGMSGSPILQDGRLAGAVSHVFLNDPTRGFGVLAEWMVQAAGFFYVLFSKFLVRRRRPRALVPIMGREYLRPFPPCGFSGDQQDFPFGRRNL